jgi:iron complex transport system permease protein
MKRFNPHYFLILASVLLVVSMLMSLAFGAVKLPIISIFLNLFGAGSAENVSPQLTTIIFDIRLPRVLLSALVGAMLAISGAAMQGLFRNPLADPSLIGVTAGASLGASLVIVLASDFLGQTLGLPLLSIGAFVGGLLSVLLVYRLSSNRFGLSVATMLLAGIAITALAGSFVSLLQFYASNEMLRRISIWQMGGLEGANATRVWFATVMAMILFFWLPRFSQSLNAMLLGESEARYLGIDTDRLKTTIIVVVASAVAVSVALAGAIGFVGLVVPHIIRLLIGPDHRYLLPASAITGALLLVVADSVSRTVLAPVELPVGLITAFIGVPFFISLLKRRHVYGL